MMLMAADDLKQEMDKDEASAKQNAKVQAILAKGGLPEIAFLDAAVTVVDAVNVFNDFETADFLVVSLYLWCRGSLLYINDLSVKDRNDAKNVPEEDDRNISDLLVDQVSCVKVLGLSSWPFVFLCEFLTICLLITTSIGY